MITWWTSSETPQTMTTEYYKIMFFTFVFIIFFQITSLYTAPYLEYSIRETSGEVWKRGRSYINPTFSGSKLKQVCNLCQHVTLNIWHLFHIIYCQYSSLLLIWQVRYEREEVTSAQHAIFILNLQYLNSSLNYLLMVNGILFH